MISTKPFWITSTLLTTLLVSACGGGGGDNTDNTDPRNASISFNAKSMINNVGNNIVLKGYQNLNSAALELQTDLAALATGGTTEVELQTAQETWKLARVSWERSEAHIFGPVDALGIDPALDSWPLDTSVLQTTLNTVSAITVDSIRTLDNTVQGFHTMEFLLFGDGVADNDKSAAELTADEIAYLQALAQIFVDHTADLLRAWEVQYDPSNDSTGPYITQFTQPGTGKVYTSQTAVMEELINGMLGIVDEVGNGKIASPFGASAQAADGSLEESQYSWNSLTDFYNNIQGVRDLYLGALDATTVSSNLGVYHFVAAHNATLASRVLTEINDAMNKIALIDGDNNPNTTDISGDGQVGSSQVAFRNAIFDDTQGGRTRIQTALTALSTLQQSINTDVLPLIERTSFSE